MDSPQNLKKRLKSVTNISKITKAMELVAATKMRRSQEIALVSRPYAFAALNLLANLSLLEKDLPELFRQRKIKKVLFLLVASDKGLAGSFNSLVFKKFEQHMERDIEKYNNEEKFFAAVGEKAFQYLSKKKITVARKFTQIGDYTTPGQVDPITDFIVDGYLEKKWDRVIIISMHFKSALRQEPHVTRVLPIDFDHIKETIQELIPQTGKFAELIKEHNIKFVDENSPSLKLRRARDYLIEPSPKIVLENLAKHLFFMQIYHLILEANASEHSARRMAMKTASDNATELSENLTLKYNKSRQAVITKEIIEITAGAEALS